MSSETLRIATRYCGPPRSGNGGYVCGRLADYIDGPAAVRLKAPPPLDTDLRIEQSDGVVRLYAGDTPIAEARSSALDLQPPASPSFAQAQASSKAYPGFARHSFPRCFACGPQRTSGDGLCIFPGPPAEDGGVAAPWIPHAAFADGDGRVRNRYLWAALDCTGGWAVIPGQPGRTIVLGEFCVRIDGAVAPDERCVAIGWPIAIDGRKRFAGSAVFGASGARVAVARATWIEVEAKPFADA
ncbi:MAG: hypothetical protein AMJ64_09940 [Betaproteobacteria bacterium SG8_39]|nr:MAG: hypothetical protein AMJ64_09940 [Betaproteobacteria bacterium SG8_39]